MLTRLIGAAIAAVLIAPLAAFAQAAAKPNVVLIITDDVGYGDLGSYGAPDVKTPNIDRLAREGTRLTDFYAAPTCSPTRAALMSGRYYQRARHRAADGPRRLSRRRARAARHRADAAAADQERGLRHRTGRQVAPGLQAGVQPERARLRLLLGLPVRAGGLLPAHRSAGKARPLRERLAGAGRRLHDRPDHRPVGEVHRRPQGPAVLPRGHLQRRALALPGAGQAVGRPQQRALRPAA